MIRSLFGKLFWSHLAVILVSTLILGGSLSYLVRDHIISTKKIDLISKGGSAIALLEPDIARGKAPKEETISRLSELTESTAWLADQQGNIIAGKPPRRWSRDFDEDDTELDAMFEGKWHDAVDFCVTHQQEFEVLRLKNDVKSLLKPPYRAHYKQLPLKRRIRMTLESWMNRKD